MNDNFADWYFRVSPWTLEEAIAAYLKSKPGGVQYTELQWIIEQLKPGAIGKYGIICIDD